MIDQNYTIKDVSEQMGLSIDTLRWYERIGLIDPVERLENGHRRYSDADLNRIKFLKYLRATGMPVSEMQRYVALYREGDSTNGERLTMLEGHRQEILRQREELAEALTLLEHKIASYKDMEQQKLDEYKQRNPV